ncbi:MAG: hypothetical protein HC942_17405, partial [Microcoleus sp. SU_5_6]|nr:hypothetical protein [Microcoleus sp. SU_5_6]
MAQCQNVSKVNYSSSIGILKANSAGVSERHLKEEEGRRKKEEGRRKREEGRRRKEEGRRKKKEEGRR